MIIYYIIKKVEKLLKTSFRTQPTNHKNDHFSKKIFKKKENTVLPSVL